MTRLSARLDTSRFNAAFSDFYRFAEQRNEAAALISTDQARRLALTAQRERMQAAGLGRLGNALGSTSDLAEGRGVHRYGNGGFSASGVVFIRSGSERSRGAIRAYTSGADIQPRKGRWLWFPTDNIQRIVGSGKNKERVTPGNWVTRGLDRKIGPLVLVRNINGYPLLVVKNVGVSLAGAKRSAHSLKKNGRARNGQIEKQFVVAFIGIPHTSREARYDAIAELRAVQAQLPELHRQALGRI